MHHVIPASEFKAALMEVACFRKAHPSMELLAVHAGIWVFHCLRCCNYGNHAVIAIRLQPAFQFLIEHPANTAPPLAALHINRKFCSQVVGFPLSEFMGVSIANNPSVSLCRQIGLFCRDGPNPVLKLLR